MSSIKIIHPKELRLRVFAGPNGSGKSTVIKEVKQYKSNNIPIDFGYYINADDIVVILRKKKFFFSKFDILVNKNEFVQCALDSGLITKEFTEDMFIKSFSFDKNAIKLENANTTERLAQIIADFLRKKLLEEKKRFSFETVFSHDSKLEIMRQAAKDGYKVYLYFVSTESPQINKYRVALRKKKGGHDVPPDKIESRYYRSLDLLYEACQLSYQVFFFDNSKDSEPFNLFAHFKKSGKDKKWEDLPLTGIPEWFKVYYSKKINK